jgi:GTPase SAR1 family protein
MEMVSWNRSKIMLVGQGRAGKTALARSMMGEPFRETPSTIGGEVFEREIREGNVRRGKLAQHKRPEKELEWMIAKNGMKYDEKERNKQRLVSQERENRDRDVSQRDINQSNDHSLPYISETFIHKGQDHVNGSTTNLNEEEEEVEGKTRAIKGSDLDREMMYKLISENINIRNNLSKLTISLCDFGGQEVFNALHAFFMTRCGVYMLVFDMELFLSKDEKGKDNNNEACSKSILFWMNSIAMHTYDEKTGKTAPVALVGTRRDKVSSMDIHDKISMELEEKYGNHRVWSSLVRFEREGKQGLFRSSREAKVLNYFPIDNRKRLFEDTTLTHLLEKLEKTMMESEEVTRKIPVIWMKALDEIREKGKNEKKSFLLLEEVTEIGEKLGISLEGGGGVWELLRYLYEMGVLIWIEEPGLREVVILDPIEYFVKPVTRIICKHLASKKDPYAIKHELPIHKECHQGELSEDWKLMLESGLVSDRLARKLLKNETKEVKTAIVPLESVEKLMLLMQRYGLMISVQYEQDDNSSIPKEANEGNGLMFFAPSLVPEEPESIIISENNKPERELVTRLEQRFTSLSKFRSSFAVFLSFAIPTTSSKKNDFQLFSYDKIEKKGFLPNGLFDRFIARILSNLPDLVVKSNDTRFIAFKDMMRIDCNGKLIRLTNHFHQNMIRVEIEEEGDNINNNNSVIDLRELVEEWLEVVKKLIRECYKCLEVRVLLPVDCEEGKNGLIPVEVLMMTETRNVMPEYISEDGLCRLTRVKFIELQSLWCTAVLLPPVNPTNPSHIMLSYAWGCNKDHVIAMERKLKKKGYDIWRDENGSSIVPAMGVDGSTIQCMADAVQKSSWVIIFVSREYFNSENCQKEAEYCSQKHKRLLFVMLEENYHTGSSLETVEGWLGFIIGAKLWYPLWNLDHQLESTSSAIAKKVGNVSLLSQNQQLLLASTPPTPPSLP